MDRLMIYLLTGKDACCNSLTAQKGVTWNNLICVINLVVGTGTTKAAEKD